VSRYLILLGGLALWASPLFAPEYIDLEQERLQQGTAPVPGNTVPITTTAPATTPAPTTDSGSNFGELYYQLQLLQQEVMELRGQVEEQSYQLRQLKEQSLERYLDIDRRISEGGGTPAAAGGAGSPAATTGSKGQELPGEADGYRKAYSLVRSQQFAGAVAAFQQFLQEYPSGKYAPNAHYWLGELYLVIAPPDLESARREFTLLLEQYPENSKTPDALYKLGKVYFDKGNPQKAREYFDRVINEHGNSGSSAVKLARDFLSQNY